MLALLDAIVTVKGVEEGGVDECTGPDHGRGPHEELSDETGESITDHLGGQADEDLVGYGDVLAEKDALGEDDIGRVHALSDDVGHDRDHGVFLDREWAEI